MVRQDGGDLDEIVQGHAGGLELRFEILPGEPALLDDICGDGAVHPLADLAADIEGAGREWRAEALQQRQPRCHARQPKPSWHG